MLRINKQYLAAFLICASVNSCGPLPLLPNSIAEGESSFSYIPLDPLPVIPSKGYNCSNDTILFSPETYLSSLPDQAVRLAVGKYDVNGTLSFGPQTVGAEHTSYQVILDYISADVTPLPIYIERLVTSGPKSGERISVYDDSTDIATRYKISSAPNTSFIAAEPEDKELIVIPTYVGVGLRLSATVNVFDAKVNLSSLGNLAAEAEAGRLSGSLVVQTLGITGNNVSKILPMPSELNQTTVQNALLSLGAIKAAIHDYENTIITPRVVGIYNPIGGGQQIINGVISVLAEKPLEWRIPCLYNNS